MVESLGSSTYPFKEGLCNLIDLKPIFCNEMVRHGAKVKCWPIRVHVSLFVQLNHNVSFD